MTSLAKHLRRRTTSGNWQPEIDGLRFIAVMAVILFHMQGELVHHGLHPVQSRYLWMNGVLGKGNNGVPLFFVISGFILARPFASRHLSGGTAPALRSYFLRRLTRLEPPYLLNLLICALCLRGLSHVPWGTLGQHFLASAFYLHRFFFGGSDITLNAAAWSLEVEVQFYLLAPLLAMVFCIRSAAVRRGLLGVAMVGTACVQSYFGVGPFTLGGQLQYFLAGLLLVDLNLTVLRHIAHHGRWDIVSLFGWPLVFWPGLSGQRYWLPFLIVLLYVAALRGRVVYRFLRREWIAIFGGMCYTIYLWHPLVLSAVQKWLDRYGDAMPHDYALYFLLQGIVKLVAVAAVSVLLFYFVERPCMNPDWPRRLSMQTRRSLAKLRENAAILI